MAVTSGITLIQKLQKLFGARAVSDMMGRTTNVQTLAQGTNNPFARTFSRKYLAKNPNGVEEAAESILNNMQFAFGNKNIQQMKNFEYNVDTLYNMKFPPKPAEAKVVDIGTKKQVTGEGLKSLKDDLGLSDDIAPTSPLGESIMKAKRLDKTIDQQAKKYSAMDEGFRRPIIRDMLLNDTRINLPENIRKSLRNRDDLQRGADPMMDPLQIFQKYYNYDTKELDKLDDMANLMSISGFNSDEIAKTLIKRGGLKPKQTVEPKKTKTVEEFAEDGDLDPSGMAQGGRAGFNVGGIAKLLNFLQGKLGKKAITTADKLSRPESALNKEMFGEFNERINRKILNVPPMPGGFKLSKEKLLKNYPEIDEDFADEIMAMDKDLQGRIIKMIEDRRKNPKAYDKLLMEKGDTLDFQGEFDRSVQRSKNAQGGIAGQLHLNQGGRVGLSNGGLPTVESLGGVPNVEGGSIVYDLGNGQYIYRSPYGFELVDENGVYTSLGAHSYTDEDGKRQTQWKDLDDLLDSGVVSRRPDDPVLLARQTESARIAAPTTTAPTTTAPTLTTQPTSTNIQTIPDEKFAVNVMMDERGNVADDQGIPELLRETGTASNMTGNVPINSMSDVMRLAGITNEGGISMGTDYSGTTLPSGGIANTLPIDPRMQAAAAKGLDPRMGRTYEENIRAMADPRMSSQMPIDIMPPLSNEFNESGKTFAEGNYKNEAEAIADLGIERYNELFNMGGRVGLEKGGPPNKGRRNFMKLMAGLASIPVLGKFFKLAKPAAKITQLKNTSTAMPTWFPKFVDKFVNNSVGKKIDADLMEFKNSDLPDVKVTRHDDGRVYVEGNNEYNEGYQIEYKPPGYEVVDEKTGKAVKTQGEFDAVEGRHVALGPEDYDTDAIYVDDLDELTTIDVAEMEKYTTGKVTKTVKNAFNEDTGLKKGMRNYDMSVGTAENNADVLRDADLLDEDLAKGGLAGQLNL